MLNLAYIANIMSNLIANKTSEITRILDVLKLSAISNNDYVSSKEPFFRNDSNCQSFQQYNTLFNNEQIPEGLNRNIKTIYQLLGNPKKEIYCGIWTIMSVDEAVERYRLDGGSNDYDRLYNLNQLIKVGSRPYDKFYFSEWFYNIT